MFAEVVGGYLSGSLALIADAGHMLTDAAAIVMALVAMWIAEKEASIERTFGYQRAEVLAAFTQPVRAVADRGLDSLRGVSPGLQGGDTLKGGRCL